MTSKTIGKEQFSIRNELIKQIAAKQINVDNKDVKFYDVYNIQGTSYLEFVSDKQQDQKTNLDNEYIFIGRMNVFGPNEATEKYRYVKEIKPLIDALIKLGAFPQ